MAEDREYEFSNTIKKIIKKSLFTEKQLQIILRKIDRSGVSPGISRGAHYRQLGQAMTKLERLYYTMAVLEGLGVLEERDIQVMYKLAKHVTRLKDSDILAGNDEEIITAFEATVKQACKL